MRRAREELQHEDIKMQLADGEPEGETRGGTQEPAWPQLAPAGESWRAGPTFSILQSPAFHMPLILLPAVLFSLIFTQAVIYHIK